MLAAPPMSHPSGRRWRPSRAWLALVALLAVLIPATPASAAPTARAEATLIRFEGGGWGHGVGMSQYGAYGRAAAGHSHEQILAHYYPGSTLAARPLGTKVRVHVASSVRMQVESVGEISIVGPGGTVVWTSDGAATVTFDRGANGAIRAVSGGRNRCRSGGTNGCGRGAVTLRYAQGERVRTHPDQLLDAFGVSGKAYQWGRLVVHPRPGGGLWTVVAGLDVDQYMDGLAEVPASWPAAALEAQAIAGRTYATASILARRADPDRSLPWDLYSSVYDQVYGGWDKDNDAASAPWRAAVARTADSVLLYDDRPFSAYYSSSNGGWSEDSGYVWATSLPYLPAQRDEFDGVEANPFGTWIRDYRGVDLGNWVRAATGVSVGEVTRVAIDGDLGASGRVDRATVEITGRSGRVTMSGSAFTAAVNRGVIAAGGGLDAQLLSTRYQVARTSRVDPVGAVDEFRRVGGRVVATGWVVDIDDDVAPTVRLTVRGKQRRGSSVINDRHDVDVVHGGGAERGFRLTSPVGARPRRVCVLATPADGGREVILGCGRV